MRAVRGVPGGWRPVLRGLRRPAGACPSCGEPISRANAFARRAGMRWPDRPRRHRRPAAAPSAARTAGPVAERRVCSVLFCDVVGFTPLSESRDPEAVRELLSRYFEVARTVIGRYGGMVEKFIGDAVMAVWGTPVAAEGDAERAVRAALDLVSAVTELGGETGVPGLAARAGVVTGEVAVTIGAVGEGMVAGDAVNTAARVQAAAQPGQVLADGATQRLAGSAIGFADAGSHRLKGKAGARTAVAGHPGAVRGRRVAAGGRAGGPADRPGRGAAHDQGAVPCRRGPPDAAAGAGVRAGRGGQVPAGLGVRQVHRWAGHGGVVAPGPVPVLRRGGGVLGAGRDRPPAARHRRGRPGRGGRGQAGGRAWTGSSPTRPSGPISALRLGRLLGVALPGTAGRR